MAAVQLLFLAALWLAAPGSADLTAEKTALLSFRDAVGRYTVPWNETTSPCSWEGVLCQSDRVVVLRLPGSGLIGEIPPGVLGDLTALRTLSLRFNALSGPLPSDLFTLVELRNLYLHGNRFSGNIPPAISSLVNLVRLNLAGNRFTGEIPAEVGELKRLRTLYLDGNQLTGQIPDVNLTLDQFNVSYNRLNGSIPARLRSMPASAFLGLDVCGLPTALCPGEAVPPPPPGPSTGGTGKGKKLSGGAIAGIVAGSVVAVLAVGILLCVLCKGKRKSESRSLPVAAAKPPEVKDKEEEEPPAVRSAPPPAAARPKSEPLKKLVFCGNGSRVFDLEDLLRASAEVLGKGTFGTAYKAVLEMGTVVAVKRLRDVNLSEEEFREKIEAVGSLSHPNLVPLLAYYFSKDEKLIVYDYMPLGSLSSLLHGSRGAGRSPLPWETRVSIALAAARGVEYIHSVSPSSSHGNIKSSNVLLDKPQSAKVSDQGLAQLGGGAAAAPSRLAGYRAPEVTDPRRVSQKADVYSFGVLLLELLTGKAPAQALLNEEGVDLPRWVQSVVREEWTAEVFDAELLRFQNAEEEMMQLLQLAVDCTAQYPDSRPSMPEVVAKIEEIQRSTALPKDDNPESSAEI